MRSALHPNGPLVDNAPMQHLLADIAVDHPVDAPLTYRIPPALTATAQVGSRVTVPLGKGNRLTPGTVLAVRTVVDDAAQPDAPTPEGAAFAAMLEEDNAASATTTVVGGIKVKDLHTVLEDVHPVPQDLLDLAAWISSYYCAPIGVTLATMVPAAVKRATRMPAEMLVHLTPAATADPLPDKLSPQAKKLLAQLAELLASGPKKELELLTELSISRAPLKRLADKGLLRLERQITWPVLEETAAVASAPRSGELVLTADQQKALANVNALLDANTFGVRLIHGVTGSGKTELYIRAIEKVVAAGKRAIVLVPEISLTPQTVRRFTQRFERVAVLHSGLRDSQRHLHWHAIANGWAQVIVGARSAVFAPAANIGLIVVDEEHDASYKQDAAPRYHGRDVAIRRAQMLGIPVLLGSATPSLESWHNATGGSNPHYGLITLATRPGGMEMPRVVVVDMKSESKERRGLHILSSTLEHHLKQTLEKKKQAIFLLNRRGYAHYIMCPRCDWVFMCDRCDSTMVVHRKRDAEDFHTAQQKESDGRGHFFRRYNQVQCHYCMTAMLLPANCPGCQAKLTYLGQGTQRAEDELVRKFPGLRLARMDSDAMRDVADYQATLQRFAAGDLDLLIGTQMIAKGLDFPNVSLVGVLNSDLAMTMPDFRAAERTFQLICQVAGRAGRAAAKDGEKGTVVVQTFQPEEPAIRHACAHDYAGFVATEMPHRNAFSFPPFGRLVRIVLANKGYTRVHEDAEALLAAISAITEKLALPVRWQGPQPPPMERLVEEYRVELFLLAQTPAPLQRLLAALRRTEPYTRTTSTLTVDVDPIAMM